MSLGGTHYSQSQIQALLAQAGWPSNLIPTMAAIIQGESSGYQGAQNHSSKEDSCGLCQVNTRAWNVSCATMIGDALTNLRFCYSIYQRQGFRAWGAYTNGSYRKYLSAITPTVITSQNIIPVVNELGNTANALPSSAGNKSDMIVLAAAAGLGLIFVLRH